AVLIAADAKLIEQCDQFQECCFSTARPIINAANFLPVGFLGVCTDLDPGFATIRKIPIHESAQNFAPPAANILTEAIVRYEIANVSIGHKNHVAMEIHCVAAVTDSALRVQPIFHESNAQAASHRMKFELARFHLSHGFGLQNSDSVYAAILNKRKHETR